MRKISLGFKKPSEKKNRKEKKVAESAGFSVAGITPSFSVDAVQPEGFSVNVRNTEPMLRVNAAKKKIKANGILTAILASLVPSAILSLFLISAEAYMAIPAVLACVIAYVGIYLVRNKLNERFRLITILVFLLAMIAVLVVLRKYIGSGFALIINGLFERSQEEQAYIYDMYNVGSKGDESPMLCMGMAAGWASALVGFITGLPDEKRRGLINTILFIAAMLGYAYLGVIPAWMGAMPLIAVFLISAGNGKLGSVWPLIIAVLLVFGGITALDPGPVDAVSRANENLRDIFALKTAQIQGMDESMYEEEFEDEEWDDEDEFSDEEEDYEEGSLSTLLIIIGVVIAIIAAAIVFIHTRLAKKRRQIRADIGSTDPNKAIGAMFPYAVRWLQCCGINVSNTAFSELVPDIKAGVGGDYANRYEAMMKMWREAVFSDHVLTEENRQSMAAFMKDTINISRKKSNWKEKLKVRFKYAL